MRQAVDRRSGKFRWGVRGDCGLIGARDCRPMKKREIIDDENDFERIGIEIENNKLIVRDRCDATPSPSANREMNTTSSVTQAVLDYTLDELQQHALQDIGSQLPNDYISILSNNDKIDALRACLIVHRLTSRTIVPRKFQLQASLAILDGKDTIITAGTGSGKTLCQLIPMLLRPNSLSMTISPLKRLQVTQVRYLTVHR